jgi:ribosome production factor 1
VRKRHRKAKNERRKHRKVEAERLGDAAPAKQQPRTIESMRVPDETFVFTTTTTNDADSDSELSSAAAPSDADAAAHDAAAPTADAPAKNRPHAEYRPIRPAADDEVAEDEADDEFAAYNAKQAPPRILVTTRTRPHGDQIRELIADLLTLFPYAEYRRRGHYKMKDIMKWTSARGFTDILMFHEDNGFVTGLLHVHLPVGPTAWYKLDGVTLRSKLPRHATPTVHPPEVILKNFDTRVGRRVGRMLQALAPATPDFSGRQVITFHNQRDFIFFRAHRYVFEGTTRCQIQEMGPRFTLKLRYLQTGLWDPRGGEMEWIRKRHDLDKTKTFSM